MQVELDGKREGTVASQHDDEVHYRLNERDEIVFVNEAWDSFAARNSGGHLSSARVLGRPLWDFIADHATEFLYRDVLARIHAGRLVRFVFRCDSADCRRRLEMEVSAGPGGCAEFRVRTLAEESRPPQLLLDADRPHAEGLLRVCGWCKKVDVGGRWAEVEEAIPALGLFERSLLPGVTHGICESCFSEMAVSLGEGGGEAVAMDAVA